MSGKPMGAPKWEYKEEYSEMLMKHMEKGYSFESFAGVLRCSKDLLYRFVAEHEDFANAKKTGTELSRLHWEGVAIDNTVEHNIPGVGSTKINSAVWCFNMKNRFGWADKQEVAQTVDAHNHNYNYDLSKLSDDKLDALTNILKDAVKDD